MEEMRGQFIILSGPSGVGKNTLAQFLLDHEPRLQFSTSATSRPMRPGESEGSPYYFLSPEDFKEKIERDSFLEWEEVYEGQCYGTLWEEVYRLWDAGKVLISDIDVLGGMSLKEKLGENALSIFIAPPSLQELERRLRARNSEDEEKIQMRLARVEEEMTYQDKYDTIIINDNLEEAQKRILEIVQEFLAKE